MSTIQAMIAFAAEAAGGGEESSQTLFYVLGGAAAVYAVIIAAIGITQHDFPRSQGTARAVYALSTVVVVAAMASSVITA